MPKNEKCSESGKKVVLDDENHFTFGNKRLPEILDFIHEAKT